jgi:hypothetical protein
LFSTACLVVVALEASHHCIMRRLSRLNPRVPDPRLIKFLQRLPSTTVRQRVSPANTHYEMLASLDCFSAERLCRQQDLAQLVTLLMAKRLVVDLVLVLHFHF